MAKWWTPIRTKSKISQEIGYGYFWWGFFNQAGKTQLGQEIEGEWLQFVATLLMMPNDTRQTLWWPNFHELEVD